MQPGQSVDIAFDALGGQSYPGKIISVAPVGTVTQGVVNYAVTVALVAPDKQIKPGMTATLAQLVAANARAGRLHMPSNSIRTQVLLQTEWNSVFIRASGPANRA